MKKIKIGSIILFLFAIAAFGAFKIYDWKTSDVKPPVITCESEEILVSVTATEEEFLADVKAVDDRSGDVSDSLVIEEMSSFTEENTRILTYAAIDESGNVGRLQRTVKYTDYKAPVFRLSRTMRFPTGSSINLLSFVQAESVLDGDLSDSIKYSLDTTIDLNNPGMYEIEYRVMDSASNLVYLPLQIEIYDQTEERIAVTLSQYLVYLPLNAKFDPQKYYAGADEEGTLTIHSGVDVKKEGVYYVDYIVQGTNTIGKSRLTVVVTGS